MTNKNRERQALDSHTSRILEVLKTIAGSPGIRLTAIADETALPKATVHRTIAELERLGWIYRSMAGAGLQVGPAFLSTSLDVMRARFTQTPYLSILRTLAEDIGETCTVGVANGDEVIFFETIQPTEKNLAVVFPLALRAPLYCSSTGRIFLAELSDKDLDRYLANTQREQFTPHTVIDEPTLRKTVDDVRRNGYAWTHSQWAMHVTGAAVPIRGKSGKLHAGLTFTAPESRVPVKEIESYVPRLQEAADLLAHELELGA